MHGNDPRARGLRPREKPRTDDPGPIHLEAGGAGLRLEAWRLASVHAGQLLTQPAKLLASLFVVRLCVCARGPQAAEVPAAANSR